MAAVDSSNQTDSERNIPIQSGKACCSKGMKRGIFCARKNCSRSNNYRVCIDMKQFKMENITVRTKERHIIVEAKQDGEEFAKKYELPEEYDTSSVTSFINSKGKLMIRAGKTKTNKCGDRFVSIEQFKAEEGAENKEEDTDTDIDDTLDTGDNSGKPPQVQQENEEDKF